MKVILVNKNKFFNKNVTFFLLSIATDYSIVFDSF